VALHYVPRGQPHTSISGFPPLRLLSAAVIFVFVFVSFVFFLIFAFAFGSGGGAAKETYTFLGANANGVGYSADYHACYKISKELIVKVTFTRMIDA
jgi:hypothetical protein